MAEVLAINDDFSGALSGTNWSTTTGWTTSGGLALNSAGNSAQPLVFNNTTLDDSNTSSNHRKIIADFTAIHADSGIQLGLAGATTQGFFGLKNVNGNLMWVAYLPDYTSRGPGQTINDTAKYVLENYAECPAVVPGTDAIITSGAAATLTVIVRYSDYNAGDATTYRSNDVSFYVNSVRVLQFRLDDLSFSSTNGDKIKNGYFALVSGNSSTRITSAQGYTYNGTTSYTFLEDNFNRANTTGYIAANASPTSPTGRVLSSSDGTTSGRGTNMNISTNRLSITGNTTRQRILNKAATPPATATYYEYDYISGRVDFGLGTNPVEWPVATGPSTDGYIFTQTSTSLQIQTWGKSTLVNTSTYSVTVSSGARVRIYVDAGGPKFFVNSTVYTGASGSGGYFEWAAILSDGPGFFMWSESGGGVIDNLKVFTEQPAAVPPALLGSFPGTIYHGFPQIEQGFI